MNQPQSNPLLPDGESNKIKSYQHGRGGSTSRVVRGYDEERTTDGEESSFHSAEENLPSSHASGKAGAAGFADGFNDWSASFQAFHQAIFQSVLYITIGVLFYSFLLDTKLSVIEAVYFSVAIFTTVGYGDITPASSNAGMMFTMVFALYGIIILGIFLGIVGDMAFERLKSRKDTVLKRTSDCYLETMLAKLPDNDAANAEAEAETTIAEYANAHANAEETSFLHDVYRIAKDHWIMMTALMVLGIPIIVLEQWNVVQGLYWLVITGTTIGLGDEYPTDKWSKLICIFYIPCAVALTGAFLGNIATAYVDRRNDAMEARFLNRALCESALETMDTNHDNKVTKDEFLVYMLKTLDKVEQDDIDKIMNLFDTLDKDKSGSLTTNDIRFIPDQTAKLCSDEIQNRANSKRFRKFQ